MSGLKRVPGFLIEKCKFITRNMGAGTTQGKQPNRFAKIVFNMSGFNQYGLYHDDCLNHLFPEVKEALRRLPPDLMDCRNFRIIRALHLSALKTVLPKNKWITYEEDREYRYLQPYIDEVNEENMEIYHFGCNNYYLDREAVYN